MNRQGLKDNIKFGLECFGSLVLFLGICFVIWLQFGGFAIGYWSFLLVVIAAIAWIVHIVRRDEKERILAREYRDQEREIERSRRHKEDQE